MKRTIKEMVDGIAKDAVELQEMLDNINEAIGVKCDMCEKVDCTCDDDYMDMKDNQD